ncbi:MAG: NUDIX hydrolase [Candidatus Tectimicrobiota bacterium]
MHPLDWQLLRSTYLIQDRWLRLRADTCQLPDKRIIEPYYIMEYPAWVAVVALTREQHVVLVRQYRHGVQQTVLELPAGAVDASDASPLHTMQRELLEETGYASDTMLETGRVSANPATHTNLTYCYLATGARQVAEPRLDPTEHLETVLLPLPEVVRLASRGGLIQALHVSAVFFALHTLGRLGQP